MPLNPSSHLLHIGSNPYCTTYFREPQSKFGEPQSKTKAFLYSQGGDHLYSCLYGTWTRNLQLQLVTSCHLLNTVLSYTLFLTTYFWWPNNICIFFWYWAYNNKIPTLKKQTKPNKLYTPFVSFHYLGWPSHASISAVSQCSSWNTGHKVASFTQFKANSVKTQLSQGFSNLGFSFVLCNDKNQDRQTPQSG